ncbi:MAG: JAB domain-containing protein [Peptococcaceae bacterium]|nr:JAB domain-containing protein [Peptococcaceae bacterium]MBQ3510306.1 DNA repair protein RadC [Peptococcaceae bacterium]
MHTAICKMKEYPQQERPRERMEMLGAAQLSDRELLAILLSTGSREYSVLELADQILIQHQGVAGLRDLTMDELMQQKGIGSAKAASIAAAVELGKRVWAGSMDYRQVINNSADAAELLIKKMRGLDRENFQVMLLNQKKALLGIETVSVGTLNGSMVHPREVFKSAIRRSASTVILAHNHPSGICEPSEQDLLVTQRLKEAGQMIGIDVIDHIIIGEDTYYSFRENQIF